MDLAHIFLKGNIGKISDLSYLPSGNAVLKISVAANTGFDKNKVTTWYNVSMFGKKAEAVSKYLVVGKPVIVIGEVSQREWTSEKTGKSGVSLDVVASEINLIGSRDDRQQQEEKPQEKTQPKQQSAKYEPTQEEIPF